MKNENKFPIEEVPGHIGWLSVCAWCYPGDSFYARFPWVRGDLKVSHSICGEHKRQVEMEMVRVWTLPNTARPIGDCSPRPMALEVGAL